MRQAVLFVSGSTEEEAWDIVFLLYNGCSLLEGGDGTLKRCLEGLHTA